MRVLENLNTRTRSRIEPSLLDDQTWLLLALAGETPQPRPRWVAPRKDRTTDTALRFGCESPEPGTRWEAARVVASVTTSEAGAHEERFDEREWLLAPQHPLDW